MGILIKTKENIVKMGGDSDVDKGIIASIFDKYYDYSNTLSAPIYWWAKKKGVKYTTRVVPGTYERAEPKSMIQTYKQFAAMDSATKALGPTSMIFLHGLLMIVCSVLDPSTEYCYNNVFADITMMAGHPKYKSPYGFLDWYTWSGWFEALGFHIMMASLKELVVMVVIVGSSLAYLMTNPTLPFCQDGDFKFDYIVGYVDICKTLTFLQMTG